jgi:adenosine deaminase
MSLANYIEAMPKVELHVHLEGAVQKRTLKVIADQNEISESQKHFQEWMGLIDKPDYKRLHDLIKVLSGWILDSENLTRIVYDVGTTLHKQNVKYAEISINPTFYSQLNLAPDDFLAAINDGRERARRAWGIEMGWIFQVPRDEPRRADDIARWVGSITARRGGVLALGLGGREGTQPANQFERPFRSIEKKEIPRVVRAGEAQGLEGITSAIESLQPNRIFDAWGLAESTEVMEQVAKENIGVGVNLARAVKQGWIEKAVDYPLRSLYDAGVPVFLGSDMPILYHTSLNEEYQTAVEKCGLGVDELENVALNAVRFSFLPDETKAEMLETFSAEYAQLRTEHGVT